MSPAWTQDMMGSAPEPLPPQARSLTVVAGSSGLAWAAWEADTPSAADLYFSLWDGRSWSDPLPVHSRPQSWDRQPVLALDSEGTPWLAWSSTEKPGAEGSRVYISRWESLGWTAPERLPMGTASKASDPSLAAGPDGSMWLAWVGFDGVDDEIYASSWDGAFWSQPHKVSAEDEHPAQYDRQPQIAVASDPRQSTGAGPGQPTGTGPRQPTGTGGQPWLVWTGHQEGPDNEILASRWTGSSWTPEQMVSQDDPALDSEPSLLLDPDGLPWVAWKGRVQAGQDSHLRILVSHWDPSRQEWSSETVASSPLDWDIDERQPILFLDQQDTVRLAWTASRGFESALAQASLEEDDWSPPQVVQPGEAARSSFSILAADSATRVAWLTPSGENQQSVVWREFAGEPDTRSLSSWLEETSTQTPAAPLSVGSEREPASVLLDPIPNRYLAFGDSITADRVAIDTPYPARLEAKLDLRVAQSEVINAGNPGERTYGGSERLWHRVKAYQPKYVLVMEGTNDVTDRSDPADVYDNLLVMIDRARNESDVDDFLIMLATLVPRLDDQNDATAVMNELAIRPAANDRGIPVCDQWQAFYNFGPWESLYQDTKHPNDDGLQLIADTFYDCMLADFPGVEEETTPPTAWIDSLPAQSECGNIPVSWDGSDNLNFVVDYDLQARPAGGFWTDWLEGTAATSSIYAGGTYNNTVEFRVRGRDLVGNLGSYSAPASTLVTIDNDPPYDAGVNPLPAVQAAPFPVSWWGVDACGQVASYGVEFKVGLSGTWEEWLSETSSTGADFDPASPAYGKTYYFRVRPRDEALNWGNWSDPDATFTTLAQFAIRGQAYNVRRQPVALPEVSVSPAPLLTEVYSGGAFSAYVDHSGDHDVEVNKPTRYGTLPPMQDLLVDGDLQEQEFVLPPHDDAVANGGFEAGTLDAWQGAGSNSPQWSLMAHTGTGGAQLGGGSGDSHLSQAINPGSSLSDPTLSFMVRLAVDGPASPLHVVLADSDPGTPNLEETLTVDSDGWMHAWYDLSALTTPPFALTFSVTDTPAVYIDEVSLGTAVQGQFWVYLPIARR